MSPTEPKQPKPPDQPKGEPTIIVDADLGAVEVEKPANDTVRLDAEELKKKIEELEAEDVDPFAD